MALLNQAYEVLSDPQKRKIYDETGRVEEPGSEAAKQILLNAFIQFLDYTGPFDPIRFCFNWIYAEQLELKQTLKKMIVIREHYNNKKGKVKKKNSKGNDLFTSLIQAKLSSIDEQIESTELEISYFTLALEMLEEYESTQHLGSGIVFSDIFNAFE